MKSVKGEKQGLSIGQKIRKLRKLDRKLQEKDARRQRASAKEAEATQRKKDRESEAKLLAEAKEFDRKHGNCDRPRPKVLEVELLALGGIKKAVWHKDGVQSQVIFGGEGETRLIFTPHNGAWWVDLEGKPSLEEERREFNKHGRGLWDDSKKNEGPDIAFHAVDALLSCFESFKGLPSNEQQKAEVQFAIVATLEALERDAKTQARKLQLAFKLLTDDRLDKLRPRLFERLLDHTWMLSCRLQRPPSKKELRESFCAWMRPQEFSALLKEAGLSWLRRGNFKRDIF